MKIVLVGYFDRGNLGDDAMRDALADALRRFDSSCAIACVPLPPFRANQLRPLGRLLRAIAGADAVVLAGGSHFHDRYGLRSVRILATHWCVFGMARRLRKTVGFAGIGVGPCSTRSGRWLTRRILQTASSILVRDEQSAEVNRELGIGRTLPASFDMAVLLPTDAPASEGSDGALGVSLVPYFSVFENEPEQDLAMVESLARAVNSTAIAAEVPVVIFPFNRAGLISDIGVSNELARRTQPGAGSLQVEPERPATEVVQRLSGLAGLVATRYHALLLGYLAQVPMIAVLYDPKCDALARQIGLPDEALLTPQDLLTPARATAAVHALLANPDAFRPKRPLSDAKDLARTGLETFAAELRKRR